MKHKISIKFLGYKINVLKQAINDLGEACNNFTITAKEYVEKYWEIINLIELQKTKVILNFYGYPQILGG